MQKYLLLEGNATELLPEFDRERIQCVVTSPPYWRARDYGIAGQFGHEPKADCYAWARRFPPCLECYTCAVRTIFLGLHRVLREDGTIWLNVGDCYVRYTSGGGKHGQGVNVRHQAAAQNAPSRAECGIPERNLALIPESIALALREDGWFIRSRNIWHKENPKPENVSNRTSVAHEHVWLITKKGSGYYYDADAIAQESTDLSDRNEKGMRNCRDVWDDVKMKSRYPSNHTAMMPNSLALRCIAAGSKPGDLVLDPFSGMATTGIAALQLERKYIGIELNPETLADSKFRLDRYIASGRIEEPTQAEYRDLPLGQVKLWEGGAYEDSPQTI